MQKFRAPNNIQFTRLERKGMKIFDPDICKTYSIPAYLNVIQRNSGSEVSLLGFISGLKDSSHSLAKKYGLGLIPAKNNSLISNSPYEKFFLTKSEFDVFSYLKKLRIVDTFQSVNPPDFPAATVLSTLSELSDFCIKKFSLFDFDLITPELITVLMNLKTGLYAYRAGIPPVSLIENDLAVLTFISNDGKLLCNNLELQLPDSNYYLTLGQFDERLSNSLILNLGGFAAVIEIDGPTMFMPKIIAEGMITETHTMSGSKKSRTPLAKQI